MLPPDGLAITRYASGSLRMLAEPLFLMKAHLTRLIGWRRLQHLAMGGIADAAACRTLARVPSGLDSLSGLTNLGIGDEGTHCGARHW